MQQLLQKLRTISSSVIGMSSNGQVLQKLHHIQITLSCRNINITKTYSQIPEAQQVEEVVELLTTAAELLSIATINVIMLN